jgi:hypothetical protein
MLKQLVIGVVVLTAGLCSASTDVVVGAGGESVIVGSVAAPGEWPTAFSGALELRAQGTGQITVLARFGYRYGEPISSGFCVAGPDARGGSWCDRERDHLWELLLGLRTPSRGRPNEPFGEVCAGATHDTYTAITDFTVVLRAGVVWQVTNQLEARLSVGPRVHLEQPQMEIPVVLWVGWRV